MFAINAETSTGESIFAQLLTGGAGKAFAVILAVIVASFAPAIVRQVSAGMDKLRRVVTVIVA
mgnify:FL=1